MSGLEIKVNSKGARQAMNALTADMPKAIVQGMMRALRHTEYFLKAQVYETFPKGRTGGLARSFKPVFIGRDGNVLSAAVKSELSYARIQDEGGTITARGKYLAVPLNDNIAVGKWPRHFAKGELTLIKRKGRPPILVKIMGLKKNFTGPQTGKSWRPMFVLVPRVTLRGRNYIELARVRAEPGILEILDADVGKIVDKADG